MKLPRRNFLHLAAGAAALPQAAPAVRIKTLFNLALNSVGEFAACTLEIACYFVLSLLQLRRDDRIK